VAVRPDELRRQVRALAVAGLSLDELFAHADRVLRRAVPWDVAAWATVDPATLLSTSCRVTGVPDDPERERVVFALEHDEREPHRLAELARSVPPAGALCDTTGGRPETVPRHELLLRPAGLCDDLRLAFVRSGACWGSVYAYRRERPFSAAEVALVGAVSGDLADAVRLALLRAAAEQPSAASSAPPGLLLVTREGAVSAPTGAGREWLRRLGGTARVPPAVTALAASLFAADPGPASVRLQTDDGTWAVLHAGAVDGAGGASTAAVIVEAARPIVVADVLAAAYGFTDREREVVGLLLRGEGNRAIAGALRISEHTVKEHVKAVFAKAGVLSRGELAATLLREQYLPRRGTSGPGPDGWFRETA
jgi:DNA-binding CsgD family transcriptional regulator